MAPEPDKTDARTEEPYGGPTERMQRTREQMKRLAVVCSIVLVIALFFCGVVLKKVLIPMNYYNQGVDRMYRQEYSEAIECFERAGGYKDSEAQIAICATRLNGG